MNAQEKGKRPHITRIENANNEQLADEIERDAIVLARNKKIFTLDVITCIMDRTLTIRNKAHQRV